MIANGEDTVTFSYKDLNSMSDFRDGVADFYELQSEQQTFIERGSLILKIINFTILPLILGTMGACAYVARLTSEQIKDFTFSSTMPMRHLVRVGLGALSGVVVGFGWIGGSLSWSPLALAFIAGYAYHWFATIDGISENFRKT